MCFIQDDDNILLICGLISGFYLIYIFIALFFGVFLMRTFIVFDKDTVYYLLGVFLFSYSLEFLLIMLVLNGDFWSANFLFAVLVFVPSVVASIVINIYRKEDPKYYGLDIGDLHYAYVAYTYPIATIFLAGIIAWFLGFQVDWSLTNFKFSLAMKAIAMGLNPDTYYYYFLGGALLAPFFNMFFTIGEEVGWRGYLLTKLLERNTLERTILAVGIIWALWHAPLIIFMGYNYPSLRGWGLLLFIPFCISHGTILIWLKIKSGGVVLPTLGHASLNAFLWLAVALLDTQTNLFHLLVGIPGIISASLIALIFYWDLKIMEQKIRDVSMV